MFHKVSTEFDYDFNIGVGSDYDEFFNNHF